MSELDFNSFFKDINNRDTYDFETRLLNYPNYLNYLWYKYFIKELINKVYLMSDDGEINTKLIK